MQSLNASSKNGSANEEIRESTQQLVNEKPFRKIKVILKSGHRLEIDAKFHVAFGLTRMTVVENVNKREKFSHVNYQDIELIFQPRQARR